MSDKLREAFEAWAKANLLLADHFYARNQITDVYECDTVLFAWAAWQAANKSRDAEIAELKAKLQISREALVYHMEQTRPIQKTIDALAQIEDIE